MPALAGLAALAAAAAQQPPLPSAAEPADEIIVTGERVARSVRETASSVDITTSERVESLSGADRIEQVLEQVPNVVIGSGGDGPAIRGQDTTGVLRDLSGFLGGSRPRTTLQIDGRAVSFAELAFGASGLWDIERVEVFRTPQTTTQGLNSIAGAIFIYSKDPTYDYEGRARVLGGNYRARQASAVLSGPIVRDQLAFRLSGDLRRGRPSSKIIDVTRGADPNNDDYSLLRFKLLGEPHSWAGSRIELTYAHAESLMPQIEGIRPPFRNRRDPVDLYGTIGTNVDSVTTVASYPVAKDLSAATTLSYGDAKSRRFAFPGFGETRSHVRDFSAESVLDWNPEGPTRLIGGLAYRRSYLDQFIDLSLAIGVGEFSDEQRSTGLFGEVTLRPIARTTVTLGLRYQSDRQQRSGAMGTKTGSIPLDYDRTFSAWLPKISLTYDLTENLGAGVLIQRAYNPGGTTIRFDTGAPDNFDAETLWSHELFARGRFGGFTLVANAFYTAMRDGQRFRFLTVRPPGSGTVTFADILNVPRARTYGAEITAEWRANERLFVRGALGLLNTKITRTDPASDFLLGREFARSPRVTASGGIDWRPLDPLRLSAQVRHHSGYFSDDQQNAALRVGNATIFDARASWTSGRTTLFGYARNLFDTFRLSSFFNPTLATAHDPREVGIGVERQF